MLQLELFAEASLDQPGVPRRGRLDAASEDLLARYSQARRAADASASAVATECAQLRSLVHASAVLGGPDTLPALLNAPEQLARVLVTPPAPMSRSTGRVRLQAVQQCLHLLGPAHGWDAQRLQAVVEAKLPRRPTGAWHLTGYMVGGHPQRRRAPTPTLRPSDLLRLIAAAGADKPIPQARCDRAILALLCFSGLRAEDLPMLSWEDVLPLILPTGEVGLAIRLARRGSPVQLRVLGPAEEAVRAWESERKARGRRSGALFCAVAGASTPLSYRSIHRTVAAACRVAGLPFVAARDLRAACAYWLHTNGCTEHEIAALLGVAHVRTVDGLLRGHLALDAQERARKALIP